VFTNEYLAEHVALTMIRTVCVFKLASDYSAESPALTVIGTVHRFRSISDCLAKSVALTARQLQLSMCLSQPLIILQNL